MHYCAIIENRRREKMSRQSEQDERDVTEVVRQMREEREQEEHAAETKEARRRDDRDNESAPEMLARVFREGADYAARGEDIDQWAKDNGFGDE